MALMVDGKFVPDIMIREPLRLPADLSHLADTLSEVLGDELYGPYPVIVEDAPPAGAVYMRCCRAWEEDENTVNWSSQDDKGYLHWSERECRRRASIM